MLGGWEYEGWVPSLFTDEDQGNTNQISVTGKLTLFFNSFPIHLYGSHFICKESHGNILMLFNKKQNKVKLYIVTTLNLIYNLHEVHTIILIINYFSFIMFLKSFQQPSFRIPCLFTFSFLALLVATAPELCDVKFFRNRKPEKKSYIHLLKVSMLASL